MSVSSEGRSACRGKKCVSWRGDGVSCKAVGRGVCRGKMKGVCSGMVGEYMCILAWREMCCVLLRSEQREDGEERGVHVAPLLGAAWRVRGPVVYV